MNLISKLTKLEICNLIENSDSISEILKKIGYTYIGDNMKTFRNRCKDLSISLEKFPNKKDNDYFSTIVKKRNRISYQKYIERWKLKLETGYKNTASFDISNHVRAYFFLKYNSKCSMCQWGEVNKFTNRVPLQLHHKNGISDDCSEENLQLLCPNCHSLTDNFGSRNKNSKRTHGR